MTIFDETAEQREHARLPRFITRPPRPEGMSSYEFDRSWQLVFEWSVAKELDRGWECRGLRVTAPIVRPPDHDYERQQREHRARVEMLADRWMADGGFGEFTDVETREEVVREVASRLRELLADDFIRKAATGGAAS